MDKLTEKRILKKKTNELKVNSAKSKEATEINVLVNETYGVKKYK